MIKSYSVRTKRAVAKVDAMFQDVIHYSMFQDGKRLSLPDCLKVLKEEKEIFPPHIFGVLYILLMHYMVDIIPSSEVEAVPEEDIRVSLSVCKEVHQYCQMAEEVVQKSFGFKADNSVIEELYALIYERYLEDVLAAW